MVGATNLHMGLSPTSQRPCWAHKNNPEVQCFRVVCLLGNLLLDSFSDFFLVKAHQDGTFDIEGWRCASAIRPLLHLIRCTRCHIDIHLHVIDMICLEPGARSSATRAPASAVHHDTPM